MNRRIPVLDKGFVCLVDYMGNDQRIVDAARVSYGNNTKSFRKDRGLIRYLLRNAHTSPFEQVVITFHIKLPIFVARQWVRHRTARLNELSGRYSILQEEFYIPEADVIARQSSSNRQGREQEPIPKHAGKALRAKLQEQQQQEYSLYQDFLSDNVSRELARITLPLSTYTEWFWQIDLHNCFHFLALRMHEHAQYEIRCYAEAIFTILRDIVPIACEAFVDYRLQACAFSRAESAVIRELCRRVPRDIVMQLVAETEQSTGENRDFVSKLGLEQEEEPNRTYGHEQGGEDL